MTPPPRNDLQPQEHPSQTLLVSIWTEVSNLSGNITLLVANGTKADMDRREINARITEIEKRVSQLALAEATVRRIEPVVEALQATKNEASGAVRIAWIVWTAAASFIASGLTLIVSKLWK